MVVVEADRSRASSATKMSHLTTPWPHDLQLSDEEVHKGRDRPISSRILKLRCPACGTDYVADVGHSAQKQDRPFNPRPKPECGTVP